MGVKNKKPLSQSKNAWRWSQIENKLIKEGYVRSFDDNDWYVWVDCVSNGTDIIYRLSRLKADAKRDMTLLPGKFAGQVFDVMSRSAPGQVYTSCTDIEVAIAKSRSLQW